jgi:hypothetical protein
MRAMRRPIALLLSLLAVMLPAAAASAQTAPVARGARVEVPIVEQVLSNGAHRYAIPIQVGDTRVLASLDTGSTGLRILPGVLKPTDAAPSDDPETYGYASGSRYEGVATEAVLSIGGLKGTSSLHLIRTIGCYAYLPHCPASRTTLDKYGIASDGLPGEGFKAIVGIDMAPGKVGNPLRALGVKRWIVELPRAGETTGRLILNPTDEEAAAYVYSPLAAPYAHERGGGLHDAVPGCLSNRETHARACGVVLLDTGSYFLSVLNGPPADPPWTDGSTAVLELFDGTGRTMLQAPFTIGDRALGTRFIARRERLVLGVVILAGAAPYFTHSVLYDAARSRIGLKPRSDSPAARRAN